MKVPQEESVLYVKLPIGSKYSVLTDIWGQSMVLSSLPFTFNLPLNFFKKRWQNNPSENA